MKVESIELVKDYGRVRALNGISLQMNQGMFGLLGPNGAGKTTFMKIITTLMKPTSGQVIINGSDVVKDPQVVRQSLGYLPQNFGFYKSLNAYEMLDYIGAMKNIKPKHRRQQIDQLLEKMNLIHEAKRQVGGYSGGMKQRLGIAQALMGSPELLVVDEPTAGLDPEERIRFRNLLSHLSGRLTVILSTHIVADIEASCTAVAVLNHGRVIFNGTPNQLMGQADGRVWDLKVSRNEYESIEAKYRIISSRSIENQVQIRLIALEKPFHHAQPVAPTLEDGYVAIMSNLPVQGEPTHV